MLKNLLTIIAVTAVTGCGGGSSTGDSSAGTRLQGEAAAAQEVSQYAGTWRVEANSSYNGSFVDSSFTAMISSAGILTRIHEPPSSPSVNCGDPRTDYPVLRIMGDKIEIPEGYADTCTLNSEVCTVTYIGEVVFKTANRAESNRAVGKELSQKISCPRITSTNVMTWMAVKEA